MTWVANKTRCMCICNGHVFAACYTCSNLANQLLECASHCTIVILTQILIRVNSFFVHPLNAIPSISCTWEQFARVILVICWPQPPCAWSNVLAAFLYWCMENARRSFPQFTGTHSHSELVRVCVCVYRQYIAYGTQHNTSIVHLILKNIYYKMWG